MRFTDRLGLTLPLIQAPMAGVSTPALAAAVCEAGALGSIAIGATDVASARTMIADVRARTDRAFNVNVFVHRPAHADPVREAHWLDLLRPLFAEFRVEPPPALRTIYTSFADDADMLAMLVDTAPPVVSFHFGIPPADTLDALRARGVFMLATATSVDEAIAIEAAGIDAIGAQGIEAGGHRGMFEPQAPDAAMSTLALTETLAKTTHLPIIAAGGIMDGAGIAAALDRGAAGVQLGTAFIACPESAADEAYRAAVSGLSADTTILTSVISGRPARAIPNRFTALDTGSNIPPDYPRAYDAGKALHAAAKATGENGFGAHWAGQGAPFARSLPAAELIAALKAELEACREQQS
ncbi:NAD(P)H-dependent flavin oxidoreductase [Sphingomonas radiodurans]|uniref:NAD(P)H-dependent flavin oxidoreductase n=1 Tax=Sphingomonas radiodurans TaxID=2890321 RepID=UPI001E459B42|nr:nitronate monooxygenase [Sphingomonas radiodurans]WBH16216.1 nitronate monooxygenase [Sphingomonas radiodurans]